MIHELRLIFTFLKAIKKNQRTEMFYGTKCLKYLLSGLLQKKLAKSVSYKSQGTKRISGEMGQMDKGKQEWKKVNSGKRVQVLLRTKLSYFVSVSYKAGIKRIQRVLNMSLIRAKRDSKEKNTYFFASKIYSSLYQ